MYVRNQYGRITEVDEMPDHELKRRELVPVSEEEAAAYYQEKEEKFGNEDPGISGVFYQSPPNSHDGYGTSRELIKRALKKEGIVLQEQLHDQKVGLLYNYPYAITQMRTEVRLLMTMFESTKIPDDWPEYLNQADQVIVPSKFCADTFADSGVEATVVPLGYNEHVYKPIPRTIPVEEGEPFTFIHYDAFNLRKGWTEVFKAFTEEFKTNEPVRLILKTVSEHLPIPILPNQYPNIEVVTGKIPEADLLELLGRSNCMVYPSRGEGFGITPLEAMATGIPAIVPNAHGISEYFNDKYMLEVKVKGECPPVYHRFKGEDVGKMVECDVEDLKKQMRYAFNNQKEMAKLGAAASQYVKRYTYAETAKALAAIIKKWRAAEVTRKADGDDLPVETI